jgi:hypothetical protein
MTLLIVFQSKQKQHRRSEITYNSFNIHCRVYLYVVIAMYITNSSVQQQQIFFEYMQNPKQKEDSN